MSAFLEEVREKKFLRVFLFALQKEGNPRRNRKRFIIEEEKERDDGLLTLFLTMTAEKTPLSFEEEAL